MKKALTVVLILSHSLLACKKIYGQTFDWAKKAGTPNFDMGFGVATDNLGNIYSLGLFSSASITFGQGTTAKTITNAGGKDIYLLKQNCSGDPVWLVRIGGASNEAGQFNSGGIVVDSLNSYIYITASFEGVCTFSTTSGNPISITSSGGSDAFIARYTTSGIVNWANKIGGTGWDEGTDLMMENSGTILASGFFSNTCTFYSQSGVNSTSSSAGNTDGYVVRYSSSGQNIGNARLGGISQDGIFKIERDNNGDILTGIGTCCSGNIQIGAFTLSNTSGWGACLAKLSNNLSTWLWTASIGGAGDDSTPDPMVDDSNNVYAMFGSASSTSLTSTSGGSFSFAANSMDMVWAKFNSSGVLQWAQLIGSGGYDQPLCAWKSANKKMYIGGWFGNSITLGSGTNTQTLTSGGLRDAFIAEFNSNGTFNTALKSGGIGEDSWSDITTYSNNIFATGYFSDTATFGAHSLISSGSYDVVNARIILPGSNSINDSIFANKTILCNQDTALLSLAYPNFSADFQWYKNNALITGAKSSTYKATTAGTYYLISSSCNGTDTSNFITITAYTLIVNAGPDRFVCRGDTTQLMAWVVGATAYQWTNTAFLLQPDSLNPKVLTDTARTFILTATTGGVCTVRDTVQTLVEKCCLSCQSETSINQGLVACYPFNGNAVDESGNSINAVVSSNISLVHLDTNRFNAYSNGYKFYPGWTEAMKLQVNPSMKAIDGKFSINCWVNVQQWTFIPLRLIRIAPIMSMQNKFWLLHIKDNSTIEFETSPTFRYTSKQTKFKLNEWANIGITCDSSNLFFYHNGNLIDSTPYTHNPSLPFETAFSFNDTMLLVGTGKYLNLPTPADRYTINGKIDDIRIYNRTLSAAEVMQLYTTRGSELTAQSDTLVSCSSDSIQLLSRKSEFYQWTPSGNISNPALQHPKAKNDSVSTYMVNLRNGRCETTDTLRIRVVNNSIDSLSDTVLCKGDSVQLFAKGGTQYLWSPATGVSNPNISQPILSPDSTTQYVVTISSNCTSYDTLVVTVKPLPQVSIRSLYTNDTIHFGCWATLFQERAVTNGTIVNWWPTGFVNDSLADTVLVTLYQSGYIGLKVKNDYCTANDSVFVTVDTSAKGITLGPDVTLCRGDSMLLKPVPNINLSHGRITPVYKLNYLYQSYYDKAWASPDSSVKYILNGGSSFWCGVKDTIEIKVVDKPTVNIVATDTLLCVGESTILFATGANSYQWVTGQNITSPFDSATGIQPYSTQYYVVKGTQNICSQTDSVKIYVVPLPVTFAGNDTAICVGDTLLLSATSPTGKLFYWGNFLVPSSFIRVAPLTSTFYTVRTIDSLCPSLHDTVVVSVNPKPVASFSPSRLSGEVPLRVNFSNNTIGGFLYSWTLDDSSVFSTDFNTKYLFTTPGVYRVALRTQSDKGCEDTTSLYIYVDSSTKILFLIPNVITPDGDGLNDNFNIVCDLPIETSCTIRNRWGQIMYEKNINFEPVNWNGREKGMECAEGVYYYFITIKLDGDRIKEYKGSLQLIK